MKRFAMVCLAAALAVTGCTKSQPSTARRTDSPGFIEEEPHINTGTGGIGAGPTGTGGSQPTDEPPAP